MHSVRLYVPQQDCHVVLKLLKSNGYPDITLGQIQGVGMVAENEEKKIIGFFWALVGHGTRCYFDYLVIDPAYKPREDIAIDLCVSLLGLLKEAGVEEILVSVQSEKVQSVMRLLGFEELEKHVVMKGSMTTVTGNLASYFEQTQPTETGALSEVVSGV